ncbi:alpha-galactosidase [Marinilabilia rubra]|uniref:Alpha-galactosidase n=1 Tax=Marinilabilia rubra TaxID=2162893 RepID=A0A2U2B7A2_9BACT|nr:alpha-galactosidase [Marinilabilia rubra]PWD98926.1 alpha-galactosidase [Marinilabilia rubra]
MVKINSLITVCVLICVSCITRAQVIHIETNNSSLVYGVYKNKLKQIHFGNSLSTTEGIDAISTSFDEAYPSFGNGCSNEVALIATHDDGTMATDLMYESHKQQLDGNIQTTTIKLKDEKKPFFVELNFKAYQAENVIEQWVSIRHTEKKPVKLEQFASTALGFKAESYYLTHFHGSWAQEMQLVEEKLNNGIKLVETKRGVRSTEYENPSFVLSLNQQASDHYGEVVMGALAWSGNFRLSFQVEDRDYCQLTAGINPFASDYLLSPKEEFVTPRVIYTYSNSGKNQGSINLHRWARKYNLRDGDQVRPIVLNSWEGAYFKFDAAKLKSMMDGAAEMGVEIFVLDDGWFGNKYPRNSDKAGLGDWEVNQEKLPAGIGDLIDHAESKGLKFGIWVEPEMVNPKSELAENHPEWIIQRKNDREQMLERNQLLLDLSNPEVQDFVFGVVDNVLTDNPRIVYVKWDANRHVQNFGSTYLDDEKQSHLWIDYTKGLESVLARLNEKYPDIIFQACASGGGRVDYGALKYTHEFWASDNTDAYERLFIQWGTNHIYPPIATGAHITKSPNHQTNRHTPLKFRCDMAFGGRLGLELSPDILSEKDVVYVKQVLETYKANRDIIQFGDLYRLYSPYDDDGFAAISYVTPEKDKAIVMAYSHEFHRREERALIRFQGLEDNAVYKISELNRRAKRSKVKEVGLEVSGSILMNRGLPMDMKKPYESVVLKLEKVK